ncbi:MAG: isoprenylcysteine carboxylmethyltransferase family protein [Burkholderiales bacterium]|nr:isoprenylcysteine carboxylmethyltransferase family protein [Burkholderiales bacterium]MDR4517402.1 isoprenylcysteine carboxylmethyltransferase family protein [Nitrosomonas sp.]
MEKAAFILLGLNFLYVGLLPKIFFREDGKFTPMWFVTAAPWGIAPVLFIAVYFDVLAPFIDTASVVYTIMAATGTVFCCVSIAIISMTIGTHRVPLALWHQEHDNDKPQNIVTWGSYKYIRHPFYSAFIIAFIGAVLIVPHWSIVALGLYTFLILNYTASKEEKRLSAEGDGFGAQYTEYVKHTGRFFPKLSGECGIKMKLKENQ